ncbi:CPBP family intramembrane metalloprotease [Sedimentitalea sp. JM2-8]|uniref:CPBP family intramembrane metalloprotease n=1 Tax=Sedimentitalea xiamensis TaxID=3050037 RepID=A0ABT7F8S9_9RHOB|nr:CPBP family intramembrane glutamic endopeptidase [Sedimentitalea xiamensis]MDK3071496.1 CPBP family intramembrane metalloprotease [Sedimentitalea xiamensis]
MDRSPYAPHERLVAPARRHPEVWRLIVGLLLVAAVAIAFSRGAQAVLFGLAPGLMQSPQAFQDGNTPVSLLVLLGSFGFVSLGVMIAARIVQRRPPLGVIGPFPLALRQFWQVSRWLLLLALTVALLPPYDMGAELRTNLPPQVWVQLLPLSLAAVLIQTSAEEILFRGYVQQSLAARFKSPLVWMALPSALFALGHYLPAEAGENAVLIALWSGAFGLFAADLTARSGTLGPAIALHLFNNVTALLFVALPDSLSGLALYTLPYSMSDTGALRSWLAVDFALLIVGWLAARVAIRR